MTTATNGWPGKPGVPLNPEEPGYHWVEGCEGENTIVFWRGHGGDTHYENGDLKELDHWSGHPMWIAQDWTYLRPCLTPDQATAMQARVAELEEILSGLLETFEGVGFRIGQTHPPRTASYEEAEQHYATNYQGETALLMYQQWCQWRLACMARAALEGKK